MFPIRAAHPLSGSITRFTVEAPLVARKWRAGQFVIVRIAEGGERIPLTVVTADRADGCITLIVQAVGRTTRELCALRAGDALADVLGPLGNPTPIGRHGRVACVGGGVGTAELLPIARALREAGNEVQAVIGARTRDLIILEDEMRECAATLALTTDDGSYGRRGLVVGPLEEALRAPAGLDAVYAIGPLPMMRAVAEATRPFAVKTYVSLNAIMLDGTGMCGGCRVTLDGQTRFACVDGPEFDGHAVDFDELLRRNAAYAEHEREADRRWHEGCASRGAA
ncbi:MAG TPA: sulfide/dihydroorotate dehydrogenase-like FAD/NAD-binding protein [Vicinamibacteria bacterium]|jgi:ferredoxin--NADP+ reductase